MTATKSKKFVALTLKEAVAAAATMRRVYKESRCACGCGGTWDRTVSGTIGSESAIWMGCARRRGSSVGGGLTGAEYDTAHAVIRAAEKNGVSVQDIVETVMVGGPRYDPASLPIPAGMPHLSEAYPVGPLATEYERQALTAAIAALADPANLRDKGYTVGEWMARRQWEGRGLDADEITDGILDA